LLNRRTRSNVFDQRWQFYVWHLARSKTPHRDCVLVAHDNTALIHQIDKILSKSHCLATS